MCENHKCSIYPVSLVNFSTLNKKTKKKFISSYNKNLYNVCYINSSIQCLFHLDKFSDILHFEGKKLTNATIKLLSSMMNKNNKILSVSDIKEAMAEVDNKYNGNNPEDANEFISNYLNTLHDEIANKNAIVQTKRSYSKEDEESFKNFYKKFYERKGSSFIIDSFYGILRTVSFCSCGVTFSFRFHSFNILELPIYNLVNNNSNTLSMHNILKKFITKKKVKHAECSKCGKDTYIKTALYYLPECLIIYFERNSEKGYIKNDIELMKTIDFEYYFYNEDLIKQSNTVYDLKGIIYYSLYGEDFGHYSASLNINGNCYYSDDESLDPEEEPKTYANGHVVLLFYEKKN